MTAGAEQSYLVVDGHAAAYRAFYAVRDLSTREGVPTNALYGFIRQLKQLEAHWKPSKMVVTFDGGSPAHRLELCPEYKAQRSPMPDELRQQLPLIQEYLAVAEIPVVLIPQQEADDVMATLAARGERGGALVRLATGDKDLMQLVSERVRILPPSKIGEEMGPAEVLAKTGVRPEQIVDWLAMIGDTADNFAGIAGVGPKTATKLMAQFGSLAACLERVDEIASASLREKVAAGREVAERNVKMVVLDRDVPGVPEWDELMAPSPDAARLAEFFERYELRQFLAETAGKPAPLKKPPPAIEQMTLF